ncbi:MAG: phosphoribosylanthranilate isomerase [Thermoplasmata archaeon]|nr:phosphoribosylanthranilate isomerase [Thermoplasmata archaeon]
MKTFVKFCGLTEAASVAEVPENGAGGFVIDVPGSPRSLTIEQALPLLDALPPGAEAWAVVLQPSAERIHALYDDLGIDRIQVYGEVPPEIEFLERHHVVPVLPILPVGSTGEDPKVPPSDDYPRLFFDLPGTPVVGGSAERVDWARCAHLVETNPGRKFVLSGGLTPENVGEALQTVRTWGVDVALGVESAPGTKDIARMRAFKSAVEAGEAGLY